MPTVTINPQLSKRHSIIIELEQSGDCLIPYLCVYLDKTRNLSNCAYIRLDKPQYVLQRKSVILSEKQKQEFIHIMETVWCNRFIKSSLTNEVRQASGYDASVDIWRDTFVESEGLKFDEQGFYNQQ